MSTEAENFNFVPKAHISISRVDHCTSIMKSIDDIFQKQLFTDVCLSCENQIINAHRLILAASSSFFHSLFSTQPCCITPSPVIVIRDMKINELKAILEFIYYGQVVIPECDLNSLIKSAESLGVYGLGKLNPDSINDTKNDSKNDSNNNNKEINNNTINDTLIKTSNLNKVKNSKNDDNNSVQQIKKTNQSILNKNFSVDSKTNKKTKIISRSVSDSEEEIYQNSSKQDTDFNESKKEDLEKKKKKKGNTDINVSQQIQQQSSNASKRQSLRIKFRKVNPDPTKDEAGTSDLLNTSCNSDSSISELASNGKRLKREDFETYINNEEDDMMSVDESDYCSKSEQKEVDDKNVSDTNNNMNSPLRCIIKGKSIKMKKNKNSLLKKQIDQSNEPNVSKDDFNEMNLQSVEVLTDDDDNIDLLCCEEKLVLKKLDSPASSLTSSRKNSVDSNEDLGLKINKIPATNMKNDTIESTSSQSILASNLSKQQGKKRKKIFIGSKQIDL